MMFKQVAMLLLSISLISCSQQPKRTNIAGSGYSFSADTHVVIAEAVVSGLQIRLVRQSGEGVSHCKSDFKDHIELNGPIGPDSTFIVAKYLNQAQKCYYHQGQNWEATNVYLNSSGGYLTDGFELGRLFRSEDVSVRVVGDQQCSSSCAVAFLGGRYRWLRQKAKLTFHAPYRKNSYGQEKCSSITQSQDLKNYYAEMVGKEIGNTLFDRTMSYCGSNKGWTINSDAARAYGILNDKTHLE